MAVPTSNVGLSSIQTEFGGASPISLTEYYRGGAYVPSTQPDIGYGTIASSSTISVGTFRGAITQFVFNQTLSAHTVNYNLKAAAIAAGWNQVARLVATITINAGVYVYANSTGAYAFDTGVTFPSGTTLVVNNSGIITGMGGAGGAGGYIGNGGAGGGGGPAFRAQAAVTINNYGIVAGGGGGGGGAGGYFDGKTHYQGGGGGGGRVNGAGGAGANAGGAGSLTAAGGGGANYGAGGAGGNWGNGAAGASPYYAGGGGGAVGSYAHSNTNINWAVVGTRYGSFTL